MIMCTNYVMVMETIPTLVKKVWGIASHFFTKYKIIILFMVALCNRADHYIFTL